MAKAAMVTVGGYAMGLVLGLFMNAMDYKEFDYNKGVKYTTKLALRVKLIITLRKTGIEWLRWQDHLVFSVFSFLFLNVKWRN